MPEPGSQEARFNRLYEPAAARPSASTSWPTADRKDAGRAEPPAPHQSPAMKKRQVPSGSMPARQPR